MNICLTVISSIVVGFGDPSPPVNFNMSLSEGNAIHLLRSKGRTYRKVIIKTKADDRRTNLEHAFKKLAESKELVLDKDKDNIILRIAEILDKYLKLNETHAVISDVESHEGEKWLYIQLDYKNRSYVLEGWDPDVGKNLLNLFKKL